MSWPLHPGGKESLLPIEYGAGWFRESVMMFWRREKSLAPAKINFQNILFYDVSDMQ